MNIILVFYCQILKIIYYLYNALQFRRLKLISKLSTCFLFKPRPFYLSITFTYGKVVLYVITNNRSKYGTFNSKNTLIKLEIRNKDALY